MHKYFLIFFSFFLCSLVYAQESELSTKPKSSNEDYFLNPPIESLQVFCSPNPTYDTTTFAYEVKEAGEISLKIYNTLGHKIDEPLKVYREAGNYEVKWSPSSLNLKGGVYYARIGVGDEFRLLKVRYIR